MLKGSAELTLNTKKHTLYSGELIISHPHETKTLVTCDEQTDFYYFSFVGKFSADILSTFKLTSKEKYYVGLDHEILTYIEKILEEQSKNAPNAQLIVSSLLVTVLGLMSRQTINAASEDHTKFHDKIAPAINAINSDCTSKLGVDEYAKMCNLSTSYFTHLFTKTTGFSPMEYKQLQRINIAKNLLSTTNLSVKEISTVIGFKDPLYFGRCFKQATGQTPSAYRAKK